MAEVTEASFARIPAAVLIPLVGTGRDASLVFIRRTDHGPHGGQIAFPGGMRDAADRTPLETALREFEEELGVARNVVEVLRVLPDVLTVTTGYEVTPVIGRIPAGLAWRPDPREVAEVFEVARRDLEDPARRGTVDIEYRGWDGPRAFPCIRAGHHVIWGLTFRILERVLPMLP